MSRPDHLVALSAFAKILEELGVPFYVGGSVASSVWGRGRSTADVDLVVTLEPGRVEDLVALATPCFYVDHDVTLDAVRRSRSFNVIHLATMIKIDAFVRTRSPYDQEAATRVRWTPLDDAPSARDFPVAAPEDIVLRKLAWYRAGGETSERQWNDVLDVLRVQAGHLDEPWMHRWAEELGVCDLVDRAFQDARG